MRLGEVVAALDALYDPRTAQSWDAVGLVCGDPEAPVEKVLLAVDPVGAVVDEALGWSADLLLTHHPLLLRPVHGVSATTPKGRVVHRLIGAGAALHVAHTNADAADPGVSDALADTLGLRELDPLDPLPETGSDKLVVFVPPGDADRLLDALAAAGAGSIGAYERCAWSTRGTGTFRPTRDASPTLGAVGDVARVEEVRLEAVVPRAARAAIVAALRATHPYEEPAFDLYETAALLGQRGIGRIGVLEHAQPLREFVARVSAALPATVQGVRAAGDPDRPVRRVAVCGGSGDGYLDAARAAGVDAYVTADLRHHPASEAREHADGALVDVSHWASEWPWLPVAARRLREALGAGTTVDVRVSTIRTDPWTLHALPTSAQIHSAPPDGSPS